MVTLRDLIEQPPLVHNDRTITWGIRPALAHFLDDAVGPDWVTLETGAGVSTLVILRKRPRQHTAVQPVTVVFRFCESRRPEPARTSPNTSVLLRLMFPSEAMPPPVPVWP